MVILMQHYNTTFQLNCKEVIKYYEKCLLFDVIFFVFSPCFYAKNGCFCRFFPSNCNHLQKCLHIILTFTSKTHKSRIKWT